MPTLRLSFVLSGTLLLAAGCDPGEDTGGGGSGGRGGSAGAAPASPPAAGTGGSAAGPAAGAGGAGRGGSAGMAGSGGAGGGAARDARRDGPGRDARPGDGPGARSDVAPASGRFSFFVTSLEAMRRLSGSQNGFGGKLTFGTSSGLEGADKICQTIAEGEGYGHKTWRAFLSVVRGPEGTQVDAIDRVGEGPWYDRNGRLIAMNKAGLTSGNRPAGDAQAVADLVDEKGRGRPTTGPNDTHDTITGSNRMGRLRFPGNMLNTCQDWTSDTITSAMRPQIGFGHSWPSNASGVHWIEVHIGRSCVPGVNLVSGGGGNGSSIGAGGGYGAFYCFALTP